MSSLKQPLNERHSELIVDCLAKAIRNAERAEGHCDDSDTYVSYLPAARAALVAYHDYIRRHS